MTDYQSDRLDRIESLIESNARAIEIMSDNVKKWQQESQIYRSCLDQLMAQTAQTQTQVAQTQANLYERPNELDKWQEELSRRRDELAEIMQFLTQKKWAPPTIK